MSRPPYPARVIAGLVVTTVEETRKLPTRVITLPMSAVSRGLQAGMRLQQNIAELAIKGDELLSPYCDKPSEQPQWAQFDEDDDTADTSAPLLADAPSTLPTPSSPPLGDIPTDAADETGESTNVVASTTAPNVGDESNGTPANGAAAGRFALYSSAPADVAAGTTDAGDTADADEEELAGAVGELDYPHLTLAQVRAKVRGLSAAELTELLDYEKGNRNRTPFVTMLDNRLASLQKKADSAQ